MTSREVTHWAISAAAPPTAAKYTDGCSCMACTTCAPRRPLPIIPARPRSSSGGVQASIRTEVVGPMEPTGLPSGAGVGPA